MKLRWTRLALQDLISLHETIADDNPRSASEMVLRIQEAADHLKKYPKMGKEGRVSGTRELVLVKTPYIVVYIVRKNEIQIVAVIHGSMRWPDSFPHENS